MSSALAPLLSAPSAAAAVAADDRPAVPPALRLVPLTPLTPDIPLYPLPPGAPNNVAGVIVSRVDSAVGPMSPPTGSARVEHARPMLVALIAGAAYGNWAAFANRDYGLGAALSAGVTQAALSLTATLVLSSLLEWLFRRPSNPLRGFWIASLVTVTTSAACLAVGHMLMGTPHVLVAIAPSVIVGTALYFVYALMLLARARQVPRTTRLMPATAPETSPPRQAHSGRIVGHRYIRPASLSTAERSSIVEQTYAVYRSRVSGWTREEFEAAVFGEHQIGLALYYGSDGELAGTCSVSVDCVSHAGRAHAVTWGFVYFRPGYRGGAHAASFGLREALRFKVRRPRTSLALLTRLSCTAAYHLADATMPGLYPSHRHQTPAHVEALVRLMSARRHYVTTGEGPWVVRSAATPLHPARLRRLENEPAVKFYVKLNPRFADGEALLAWIPLNPVTIATGALRALRAQLTR